MRIRESKLASPPAINHQTITQLAQICLSLWTVDNIGEESLQLAGGDVRAVVEGLNDVEEESTGMDVLQVHVLVMVDEDLFEEGSELVAGYLAAEG